jgi:uncharacterized protein (TIGR02453 family)
MPSATFSGFSPQALTFLRGLERNNKREWFQPRKHTYEQLVRDPLDELIECINAEFAECAPRYVTPVAKARFRIYRDTRFSHDKRPYKTRVAAAWYPQGMSKTAGGCFYFHFNAKELLIFAGVYLPERAELLAIRELLAQRHEEFRDLLSSRILRKQMGELQGEQLSRVPKGFDKFHPAEDLVRRRQWFVEATIGAQCITTSRVTSEIMNRFRAAIPMVEFLNQPFIKPTSPRKLPFMAF